MLYSVSEHWGSFQLWSLPSLDKLVEKRQWAEVIAFVALHLLGLRSWRKEKQERALSLLHAAQRSHHLSVRCWWVVGQLELLSFRHFGPHGQVLDTVILAVLTVVGVTWSVSGVVGCFYFIPVNTSDGKGNIDILLWGLLPCCGIHMSQDTWCQVFNFAL